MNQAEARPAVCEIELKGGFNCGVTAIGRCLTCGRAFCRTHQAWSGQTYYIDQCASCFAQTPEEVERVKQAKRDAEIFAAIEYFQSGSARTAFLTSGVPPVDISWTEFHIKKVLFVLGTRDIEEIIWGRGWILGEFRWGNEENWLTALMDLSRRDLKYQDGAGLTRVHRVSRGYEAFAFESSRQMPLAEELIKAMQAVKRLTGASS